MADVHKTYHDIEIVGLYHDKKNKSLNLTTIDNKKIKFKNVVQLELNYFSDQNIIFDIYKYSFELIPKDIREDYPFLNNDRLSRDYSYYYLDSSTGMTGIIICDQCEED